MRRRLSLVLPFLLLPLLFFSILFIGASLETPSAVAQAPPQTPASDAILRKVDSHYNHLTSLRTRYTEHYAGMGMDRTETGTLFLKKPGRMKWMYDKPAGKLFVLDGRYGWSYTPGDTQATRIAAKQLDDLRSPLRFLLGHTELRKELDHISLASAGSGYTISGIPKGMAQRIRLLTLQVTSAGAIEEIRLEEADGSLTEFSFTAMQEDAPIQQSDFTFMPPAGVAVIDGLPPI